MEFTRCTLNGAMANLFLVGQTAHALVEHVECPRSSAREFMHRIGGNLNALDSDAEERRMLEGKAPKDKAGLDEVGPCIACLGQGSDRRAKVIKGTYAERRHKPILGAEDAIDGASRCANLVRHATHRECGDSFQLCEAFRSIEEQCSRLLVVFSWPSHVAMVS
jgi:hypothetical protein